MWVIFRQKMYKFYTFFYHTHNDVSALRQETDLNRNKK